MADWDANSPELDANLRRVLRDIHRTAAKRPTPTVEDARYWQIETMRGLEVPESKYVGAFRGEPGMENVQVRVGARYGVAAPDVPAALAQFEEVLQRAVLRLDELIPVGSELSADQLAAVMKVCAWAHAEWVRIHPFANGNGRTARLWVNSIAARYGLPPFVAARPRPAAGYGAAGARAMQGDWEPTVDVLYRLLAEFLQERDDQDPGDPGSGGRDPDDDPDS